MTGPSPTVLVIDDDPGIREALETVLGAEGYEVVTATGALEALDLLRGGVRPDLILLDLRMPGMDGARFRALQLADPTLAAIPVVVLSADRNPAGSRGQPSYDAFLAKPVGLDDLLETVGRFARPAAA